MGKGLQGPRFSHGRQVASPSTALASKANNVACTKVSSTSTKGPALVCERISDFSQPKGRSYRGLLIQRPQVSLGLQQYVDKVAESGAFGDEQAVQEHIDVCCTNDLVGDLSDKSQRIVEKAVQAGLPEELGCRVRQDFEEIGMEMTKLVPTTKEILLKLDIMGENACGRWHRDNYVGRAVISYNCSGTQFVSHDNVDMFQLENGGLNNVIVRDKKHIINAGIGDILFMKGNQFPESPNGLIHRSPPPCWRADGTVMNRLLLKVDLN